MVNKEKTSRRRQGLKPGEYRKRGPVYVERLRSSEEQARYAEDNLYTTDIYNVTTHRDDGHWTHTVELHGEMMKLPGKVIERIISQRKTIEKEQRSDRGKISYAARSAQAPVNQDEEESERLADLEGL